MSVLVSVNVGLPRVVMSNGDPVSTGIFKEPVAGHVMLRTLNLDGDRQARKEFGAKRDAVHWAIVLQDVLRQGERCEVRYPPMMGDAGGLCERGM